MKNVLVVLLTVCLMFSATACSAPNDKSLLLTAGM